MREPDPETGSRWREDKVATITSYVPGDGKEIEPVSLITTHVATLEKSDAFGRMARVEAERRGVNQAVQAVVIGGLRQLDRSADRAGVPGHSAHRGLGAC